MLKPYNGDMFSQRDATEGLIYLSRVQNAAASSKSATQYGLNNRSSPRTKMNTFINKDFDELGAMPRKDQGEACADYRQQLPKPTTMRACGTGYNAGYEWGLKEADAIVETANAAGMSSEPMAEVAEVAEEELEEEPEEEPVES